jgi:hypothetical protein
MKFYHVSYTRFGRISIGEKESLNFDGYARK